MGEAENAEPDEGGINTPDQSVSRTLSALRAKAQENPEHRFRGLARLLNAQMLREAFGNLKRKASPGIDGVDWAGYAESLEENLSALEERLRSGRYRARCVKRRWIILPSSGSAEWLREECFALRAWQCEGGK